MFHQSSERNTLDCFTTLNEESKTSWAVKKKYLNNQRKSDEKT